MNLWKQLKQQLQQELIHLVSAFPGSSTFFENHSKATLKAQTMEMIKDPNAREPKLYLNAHPKPLHRLKFPLVSAVEEKYHVHTPTMRVKLKRATINI